MKWRPGKMPNGNISPYYIGSDCLRYSISKARMNKHGEPDRFRYTAHHIGEQKALGVFDTGDEAKECCEQDAKRRAK